MSNTKLISTRKATHLLDHAVQLADASIINTTACGRKLTIGPSPWDSSQPITGEHVAGPLAANLCGNCRRTESYQIEAKKYPTAA